MQHFTKNYGPSVTGKMFGSSNLTWIMFQSPREFKESEKERSILELSADEINCHLEQIGALLNCILCLNFVSQLARKIASYARLRGDVGLYNEASNKILFKSLEAIQDKAAKYYQMCSPLIEHIDKWCIAFAGDTDNGCLLEAYHRLVKTISTEFTSNSLKKQIDSAKSVSSSLLKEEMDRSIQELKELIQKLNSYCRLGLSESQIAALGTEVQCPISSSSPFDHLIDDAQNDSKLDKISISINHDSGKPPDYVTSLQQQFYSSNNSIPSTSALSTVKVFQTVSKFDLEKISFDEAKDRIFKLEGELELLRTKFKISSTQSESLAPQLGYSSLRKEKIPFLRNVKKNMQDFFVNIGQYKLYLMPEKMSKLDEQKSESKLKIYVKKSKNLPDSLEYTVVCSYKEIEIRGTITESELGQKIPELFDDDALTKCSSRILEIAGHHIGIDPKFWTINKQIMPIYREIFQFITWINSDKEFCEIMKYLFKISALYCGYYIISQYDKNTGSRSDAVKQLQEIEEKQLMDSKLIEKEGREKIYNGMKFFGQSNLGRDNFERYISRHIPSYQTLIQKG